MAGARTGPAAVSHIDCAQANMTVAWQQCVVYGDPRVCVILGKLNGYADTKRRIVEWPPDVGMCGCNDESIHGA